MSDQKTAFIDKLREFAEMFDPPIKVDIRKSAVRGHSYLCLCDENNEHMSFRYIDGCHCSDGCFFHAEDDWKYWFKIFSHGGDFHFVKQLSDHVFRKVKCYTVPSFTSMSELKLKLAVMGPQTPEEKIANYESVVK